MGISLTELAKRLGISVAGVGYSVERGEIIARENDYHGCQAYTVDSYVSRSAGFVGYVV